MPPEDGRGNGQIAVGGSGAHTWNSHSGAEANPQGSKEPAVANRLFDKKTGTYETDEQYNRRINTDISLITNKIKSVTGNRRARGCGLMVRLTAPP